MNNQLNFSFVEEPVDDKFTTEDLIVLSLHPNAYNLIFSGKKKYEYRTRFRKRPTIAFIYVTVPEKVIKGVVILGKPILGTPEEIADIAEKSVPGNGKSVYDYFLPYGKGYAIPIRKYIAIKEVSLDILRKEYSFIAPQFYLVLKNNIPLMKLLLDLAGFKMENDTVTI